MTYQRVLDTQRFLVQQEDQLARTEGDVALNFVATYKALGGGWEIPHRFHGFVFDSNIVGEISIGGMSLDTEQA